MTTLDRRHLLVGSGAWLAARGAARADVAQDRAVFWKATPPGAASSILFGYDVIAAAAAPNLLATGERLAEPTRHLIMDMPSARLPAKRIPAGTIPPLAERYGPETAQRIVDALRVIAPQWTKPDIMPGSMIALLLFGEGRTPNGAGDTLPGTIFGNVFRTCEAVSYLVPLDEVISKNLVFDVSAKPGPDVIAYLLDRRAKLGPLGKYAETLYREERLYDLWRFKRDLDQHGLTLIANGAAWMETLADRAVGAVKAARKPTFLMMPSDNFVRDDGILARLQRAGVPVEPAG